MKDFIVDFDLVRFVKNNEVKEVETVLFANTMFSIYNNHECKEDIFEFYNKNKFRIAREINEDFKLNVSVEERECVRLMRSFKEGLEDRKKLEKAMNVKFGPMFETRQRPKMKI